MAKKSRKTTPLGRQVFFMFKFLGVDAREIGLTLEQAEGFNERSKNGERAEVRQALLDMGAVAKTDELPDLTVPSFSQGMALRRALKVDIRTAVLTREQATGFISQVKDGANGSVREALLAMGATDAS
jgi:hypothetical protein